MILYEGCDKKIVRLGLQLIVLFPIRSTVWYFSILTGTGTRIVDQA